MSQSPKAKAPAKPKQKPKKLTKEQRKQVYKMPDNWTEMTGSDTFGYGGRVPKRRTDND